MKTLPYSMQMFLRTSAVLLVLAFASLRSGAQHLPTLEYVENEVIVLLEPAAVLDNVCAELTKETGAQFSASSQLSQSIRLWVLQFDAQTLDAKSALAAAHRVRGITLAQLNHTNIASRAIPDDDKFSNQWALYNNGTNGNGGTTDVDAVAAWDIATGGVTALGDTIVVAVIDQGFDLAHPDLAPNIYTNRLEIPDNSLDDDGNGFVDDVHGWNFYVQSNEHPSNGHGNHVLGIIGAVGNNGIGVAGVNWNVKLLPVTGASSLESTVLASYGYVLDMRRRYNESQGQEGAYIVATNSSFGVNNGHPEDYPLWCAMYDSLGYEGIVSATATANEYWNIDEVGDIPTSCDSPFMISVTNSTSFDVIGSHAGYGQATIDLAAPGTKIYSTLTGTSYGYKDGTSMASPMVAGAVALMYSAMCPAQLADYRYDPPSMAMFVRDKILDEGVDHIEEMEGLLSAEGRLNLLSCLESVSSTCLQVSLAATDSDCGQCNGSLQATVSGADGAISYLWSNGAGTTVSTQGALCPGIYEVTVVDDSGDSAFASAAISDVGGPELTIEVDHPTCPESSDGGISVSGGSSYHWLDGNSANIRSGLDAGEYYLIATDASTCTTAVIIEVIAPDTFHAAYSSVMPDSNGTSNGEMTISLFGGTPPYTYQWSNGANTRVNAGLTAGMYLITVTDANGCIFTDSNRLGFPSSIEKPTLLQGFRLYPNPASDMLFIESQAPIDEVVIFTMDGRMVLNFERTGSLKWSLPVGTLPEGVYLIQLRQLTGSRVEKVVVRHE